MSTIEEYVRQVKLPDPNSHKGQNGKLLLIGGSELFHAASKWSLDVASKFVDMVFYSSVPTNNELIKEAKANFWNGMVIGREEIESYIEEADCILIGPGMQRQDPSMISLPAEELSARLQQPLTADEWNNNTERVVNHLVDKYPQKKWVIDAGALQMLLPDLLNENMIITPHQRELERLQGVLQQRNKQSNVPVFEQLLRTGVTIVLKGPTDFVYHSETVTEVTGGNAGMTKGGTGDVLAGLIAALYTTHDAETAAVVGSYINKRAGEKLFETNGTFFNASDLVEMVPQVLWEELSKNNE